MESTDSLLSDLNDAQRKAVLHGKGPALLLAGPGSGKTRTLVCRIVYLLCQGVSPANILTLTFTNKASREMRDRVKNLLKNGSHSRDLWMGTFHAIFARLLRIESDALAYTSKFSIYDTEDTKRLIRSILKEKSLESDVKPSTIMDRISRAKNQLISWEAYALNPQYLRQDQRSGISCVADIYQTYVKRCLEANAMDFDDLLYNTYHLLNKNPDILEEYQQRFQHILVDEYQDTNSLQYAILKKLLVAPKNFYVVGDDAQSIYGFRGAEVGHMLDFRKDYPEASVYPLEQNYRSTPQIVKASNFLIKNNKQLSKELWTENPEGHRLCLKTCDSDIKEAEWIASMLLQEKIQGHYASKEMAVLYRINAQSRLIEKALRKRDLNYRIYGGLSFYQRKEIKDLLSYLLLIVNPKNEIALRRVINYPKRGIGEGSVQKLIALSHERQISLWEALNLANQVLPERILPPVRDFIAMIGAFQKLNTKEDAYDITYRVAKETGILEELHQDKTTEGIGRYENLKELIGSVKTFVDDPEQEEDRSLGVFLEEISLMTDLDREKENKDAITLMTVHMAKGSEYKVVFIAGMEEELFPFLSHFSKDSPQRIEEERRLFYVAMTRAKEKLFLSHALVRRNFKQIKETDPSRFLSEIDSYLEASNTSFQHSGNAFQPKNSFNPLSSIIATQRYVKESRMTPSSADIRFSRPSSLTEIRVGVQVRHSLFGRGLVKKLEGDRGSEDKRAYKAWVDFDKYGEKKLLLSYARLEVISDQNAKTSREV
ncbi:MAG: UvrD-helicase domain-containing protein [Cytophagales bacterium]|nr:UvrD-helicase domain-containing protein [Cytophagales bacterium]